MRMIVLFLQVAALLFTPAAHAQTYPSTMIHLVVNQPAGGVVDVTGRLIAQKLSEALGQSVVVENRVGASGIIGADAVAKSAPDGYTLLFSSCDFVTAPTAVRMASDKNVDLVPLAMVARAPLVLVANTQTQIDSAKTLLAAAKSKSDGLTFSSPGIGTVNHLAAEWLAIEAGVKLLHVPYRGGAPAATGVASGDVAIGVLTPASVTSYLEAGKIKIIGLMTDTRSSFLPDWPTLAEQGVKVDAGIFIGIFAPKGVPAAVVARLNEEVRRILDDGGIRQRLNALGTEPMAMSQDEFIERIRIDTARYNKVASEANIKIQP